MPRWYTGDFVIKQCLISTSVDAGSCSKGQAIKIRRFRFLTCQLETARAPWNWQALVSEIDTPARDSPELVFVVFFCCSAARTITFVSIISYLWQRRDLQQSEEGWLDRKRQYHVSVSTVNTDNVRYTRWKECANCTWKTRTGLIRVWGSNGKLTRQRWQ